MNAYDVIIVGAGPAGSTAAALLASAGKRVLIFDKSKFPRDKVCGDCLNPSAWRILDRLGVAETIRALDPTEVQRVEFAGISGHVVAVDLPRSDQPEIVVRRRELDELLIRRAVECGAEFRDCCTVTAIEGAWIVNTSAGQFSAPVILAADGRNSTIGRMTRRLPAASRERIAIQAHVPSASLQVGNSVRMFFHRLGYGGIAS
ncbi:MAG: NAD(P)/FAD-dependent oxidoreductase, partial [Chthoniobacterales bacterium]